MNYSREQFLAVVKAMPVGSNHVSLGGTVCRWADCWWVLFPFTRPSGALSLPPDLTLGYEFDAFWKLEQWVRTGTGGKPIPAADHNGDAALC